MNDIIPDRRSHMNQEEKYRKKKEKMQPGPVLKLIRRDKDPKNMFQELPHELFCATVKSGAKMLLQFPTLLKHMLCVEFRFSSSELQKRKENPPPQKKTSPTLNAVFSKAAFTPRGGEVWMWTFFVFLRDSFKPHGLKWLNFNFLPFKFQKLKGEFK